MVHREPDSNKESLETENDASVRFRVMVGPFCGSTAFRCVVLVATLLTTLDAQATTLIGLGSTWKYQDSAPIAITTWTSPSFGDGQCQVANALMKESVVLSRR